MHDGFPSLLKATMTIRVHAQWNHSRFIEGVLALLFPVNILAPSVAVGHIYATATFTPATPPFTGCSIIASTKFTYLVFLSPLVYETLIIVLTIIKSYPILRLGSINLPLSNLLFRDGLVFYCAIVAAEVLTLVCTYSRNTSLLITVPIAGPSLPVSSVACNHLLMRLQSVLINQDVLALDSKSPHTNGSIGLWTGPGITTEFSLGTTLDFERGRGRKRTEELATGCTDIVLEELAAHQHQSPSPSTSRDTRNIKDGANQGTIP
jgi:hypothetical protein